MALSADLASPLATLIICSAAFFSRFTLYLPSPRSSSKTACSNNFLISWSLRLLKPKARERDNKGGFTSKYGFSVVAPIRITVPSSTWGKRASCWALLNLWISSTNRIVRWLYIPNLSLAFLTTSFISATPDVTALSWTKNALVVLAITLANVVLPVPGGP